MIVIPLSLTLPVNGILNNSSSSASLKTNCILSAKKWSKKKTKWKIVIHSELSEHSNLFEIEPLFIWFEYILSRSLFTLIQTFQIIQIDFLEQTVLNADFLKIIWIIWFVLTSSVMMIIVHFRTVIEDFVVFWIWFFSLLLCVPFSLERYRLYVSVAHLQKITQMSLMWRMKSDSGSILTYPILYNRNTYMHENSIQFKPSSHQAIKPKTLITFPFGLILDRQVKQCEIQIETFNWLIWKIVSNVTQHKSCA